MARGVAWDRWPEVDALFAEALDRAPGERHSFLVEVCDDDVALLETVSVLLAASDRAAETLGGPGAELLRAALTVPSDEEIGPAATPGDQVGQYRLLRELGRGGMATVFEAERADGAYDQRVAVKVLRRGDESEHAVSRSRAETQILSTLAHPNISRLLDAGTTRDGRAYLVMELVEGEPITTYADRRNLTVGERLELFLQVIDAVGFAHARLVIHRDLKPSNVLVTDDGRVKLLDFGVAKLLEPDSARNAPTLTAAGWMTPAYAAPEQILGRPVTTATDVHGLGVLLYELLAGQRPFGGDGAAAYDLARAVCEEVPVAPSVAVAGSLIATTRRTDVTKLRRRLAGDLDAIVGKALRKEPEERYVSAQALAEDIERHIAGFPVRARAGLRTYRARKFLRRHWMAVAVAATTAAVLLGSSLVLWRALERADQAAARATQEAENARMVTDFLADVFRGRDPEQAPADTVTARELLAWGSERVEAELAERPALQASLLHVLGSAYANLGLFDRSVEHHTRAIELLRRVYGDRSGEVAAGLLELSRAYRQNRDAGAALAPAREALAIRLERFGPRHDRAAEAMVELGRVHSALGEPDSAETFIRRALGVRRAGSGENDSAYVVTLLALAPVRRAQGELDDAERLYDEAIPRFRDLGGAKSELALHLNNLAYLLRTRGEYDRAARLYREALEISASLLGRGHPNSLLVANNLAAVLHEEGDTAGTLDVLAASASAARGQWSGDHWRVGLAHAALGRALLRLGRVEDAFDPLREARRIYAEVLGADHDWTSFAEAALAAGHVAAGRDSIGGPYLDRMYRYLRDRDRTADTAEGRSLLGQIGPFVRVLQDLGLRSEAERFEALLPPQQEQAERTG